MPASTRFGLLASPEFLTALTVLVVNDFALKPLLHNAVTGKLSDFAGLFALTVFVATLWPRGRHFAGCVIGAAFVFWKTPFADPLLEWLNSVSPFVVGRTIDLTDLTALPMIGLAVWLAPRLKPRAVPKALELGLVAVALVAFTATSRFPYVNRSTMDVTQAVGPDDSALQSLFDEIAAGRGLRCAVCVPVAEGRVYVSGGKSDVRSLIVDHDRQTLVFTVVSYDRSTVRSMSRRVRRAIRDRFPDIAVIDTTADFVTVVEGVTTVFVVRPAASREGDEQRLASIVANVARSRGLDFDDASSLHYARTNGDPRPEYQGLVLESAADPSGILLVRVVRRDRAAADLHRIVTEDLATRLRAEFGPSNVITHDVQSAAPEAIY